MEITSTAPGRICLFGEHQDYIGFPIIAAAIDRTIRIKGSLTQGSTIHLDLPDLQQNLTFNTQHITYDSPRDYLKSTVRVLQKKQLYKEFKIKARIEGDIPIQAGTSSSSALVVAWTGFLLAAAHQYKGLKATPSEFGELAYLAEVEEFSESGGRMDQYTSAIGGIVHLDFHQQMKVTPLPAGIHEFVLGDSQEPKDTQKTLKRIRTAYEAGFTQLSPLIPYELTPESIQPHLPKLSTELQPYIRSAITNHHITNQAKAELEKKAPDASKIAHLMNQLQILLREDLKISTPKLNRLIDVSMKAGALSAKINGSGEGGCMFAFCPGKQQEVAEAIRQAGGKPYIINIGPGLNVKTL